MRDYEPTYRRHPDDCPHDTRVPIDFWGPDPELGRLMYTEVLCQCDDCGTHLRTGRHQEPTRGRILRAFPFDEDGALHSARPTMTPLEAWAS